jgi:EmrB/QacA subfamily drug resistance transporter
MAYVAKSPCDEGVIAAGPHAVPCSPRTETWVLAATILGSSMAFIDGSVVNVALPVLQKDLKATVADVQWVIESYMIFLSALILVGGAMGDRFGRRRIFGIGIALFTAASVVCGLAQNTGELIAARGVQGLGGALLVPGSLAIISACFSQEQRGKAIGTWSGFSAITAGAGPLAGGLLIEHVSWRAIFFINVPIAALVVAILIRYVPESRDDEAARLDWLGAALATMGLGSLVYGLVESTTLGMGDPIVVAALVLGALILAAFVLAEAKSSHPMMPLHLFRSRAFAGMNVLTLLLYGALGEALFYLPFNLISVQGYTAAQAGAAFLPFIILMFVLSRWSGGLINRVGARLPLIVGPLVAGAGMALFSLPGIGGSYWTTFFPAALVLGLGMAIAVAPLTTVVMSSVDARHSGIASGINNAAARTAGLLSIAAISIVVLQVFSGQLSSRLSALKLPPGIRDAIYSQHTKWTDIAIPTGLSPHVQAEIHHAIGLSFVDGFRVAALVGAALAGLSAVAAAVSLTGRNQK